ncbi:MAG TPA: integrin alpha [Anaeromyxobacteraceae bacterium]|nr:integrin alpha [Anaeromyxobacteraceae bacterium]
MRVHGRVLALIIGAALATGCKSSSGGAAAPPSITASQLGTSGAWADYDGDGRAELLVGAPMAAGEGTVGAVFVYRDGGAADPIAVLTGDDGFGSQVAAVGDVDGDGVVDFAVAALHGDGPEASLSGSVTVYRGGTSGQVLRKLGGEQALDKYGISITGGCDLDADGHPDLVVGATGHSPGPDRYLGGAYYVDFGPDLSPARRLKIPATLQAGILGFASACGDVNADGVDDLVVSAIWTHGVLWHASKVLVFLGRPGFTADADAADVTIDSTASHFGDALAVIGDVDGDGYRDIAIGVPAFYAIPAPTATNPMNSLRGRVLVVKGGPGPRTVNLSPPPGTPVPDLVTTLYGKEYLERFGSAIQALGDVDGDGLPDLAIAAPHGHAEGATSLDTGWVSGRVDVYLGRDLGRGGAATPTAAARSLSRPGRTLHYGSFLASPPGGGRIAVGAPTAARQDGAVFVEDLAGVAP